MAERPTGTVTFLFTDIEGSTRLLQQLRDRYDDVLSTHARLLREAVEQFDGHEIDTQGDAFFVAFARARDAVAAAVAAQRALTAEPWPDGVSVRVRMGIHTGEPLVGGERYVGMGVNRGARICAAGHGGQVLLSNTTRELVEDDLPGDVRVRDLGEHELEDLNRPERIFQLEIDGLPSSFPPLRTAQASAFEGREGELARAAQGVARPRFTPPDFVEVRIDSPPEGFQHAAELGEVGTRWAYVTVRARDAESGMPFARWEAELLVGALREAFHARALADILGSTTTVLRPNGTHERSSGVIAVPFGRAVLNESEASRRIQARRARDPRLRNTVITFVHAVVAAPIAVTTLPALGAFRPGERVAAALLGPLDDYEGAFVTVRAPSGRAIRAFGYASKTGVGMSWSDSTAGSDTVVPQGVPSTR
jgi:class 3 adenylate cyclase